MPVLPRELLQVNLQLRFHWKCRLCSYIPTASRSVQSTAGTGATGATAPLASAGTAGAKPNSQLPVRQLPVLVQRRNCNCHGRLHSEYGCNCRYWSNRCNCRYWSDRCNCQHWPNRGVSGIPAFGSSSTGVTGPTGLSITGSASTGGDGGSATAISGEIEELKEKVAVKNGTMSDVERAEALVRLDGLESKQRVAVMVENTTKRQVFEKVEEERKSLLVSALRTNNMSRKVLLNRSVAKLKNVATTSLQRMLQRILQPF